MDRFFGGPVLPTLFKLAIASIAVGVVLAVFGIKPIDLWRDFLDTLGRIWEMGFRRDRLVAAIPAARRRGRDPDFRRGQAVERSRRAREGVRGVFQLLPSSRHGPPILSFKEGGPSTSLQHRHKARRGWPGQAGP